MDLTVVYRLQYASSRWADLRTTAEWSQSCIRSTTTPWMSLDDMAFSLSFFFVSRHPFGDCSFLTKVEANVELFSFGSGVISVCFRWLLFLMNHHHWPLQQHRQLHHCQWPVKAHSFFHWQPHGCRVSVGLSCWCENLQCGSFQFPVETLHWSQKKSFVHGITCGFIRCSHEAASNLCNC